MRKITFIAALLCTVAMNSYAQQAPADTGKHNFSLADCINYAYQHQDSVMNAGLDVKSAEYKVKETIGSGLPQINGSVTFQDFLQPPVTVGPNLNGIFTGGALNTNAPLVKFPFGAVAYNNTYSVSASQLLFSGTFIVGLKAVKTFRELSQRSLVRTKIETNVNVTKAYYQVLVSNEQLKLLDANIAQLKQQFDQTTQQNKQGFVERLENQLHLLKQVPYSAKFGGATGNYNAHNIAYGHIDWKAFGNHFVNDILGLSRSQFTTQIEHYDNFAAQCDALKRINNILVDLDRDMWAYISMNYFKQKIKAGEIGSSAMPHKVNPIDFENSEGNLGIANALFEHLAAKLPVSRLQRDLTDSTVLRNIGVPVGHTLIAIKSTIKGLNKLLLNEGAINAHLEANWAVVAEAIQTILRREGYPNPYEALKELTRTNTQVNADTIAGFVDTLDVSDSVKAEIKQITPSNYTGI